MRRIGSLGIIGKDPPPIAEQRLSTSSGRVIYELKSMWRDGTRAIALTPLEFIEKLVAIIPQPRIHMTRFHGILGPHAALRSLIVPKVQQALAADAAIKEKPATKPKVHRLGWAELLKRIFAVDLSKCPACSGTMKLIATVLDPIVITQTLNHLAACTRSKNALNGDVKLYSCRIFVTVYLSAILLMRHSLRAHVQTHFPLYARGPAPSLRYHQQVKGKNRRGRN